MNISQLPVEVRRRIPNAKIPVEYEAACKALVACMNIDEAKYFSDKADALAAWAKIYKSDRAKTEARNLKMHAYRRMGQLSEELQPIRYGGGRKSDGKHARLPGPRALLMDHGLSINEAKAARFLGSIDDSEFSNILRDKKTPISAMRREFLHNPVWAKMSSALNNARTHCRAHSAPELAKSLSRTGAEIARALVVEISEWLDEFERHLPKP